MIDVFSFFKQRISPSYLGVDIGTTSIKIAEVRRGDKLPRIENYSILESQSSLARANTALQTSTLKLFDEEVTEFLKMAVSSLKTQTRVAVASLPSFSAFTTILTFPQMSAGDLQKSITYEARQYIPLPISEVALDWSKVGEYKDDKGFTYQQILLVSVPQEQIKKYQAIFAKAGLSLTALEVESLSLGRAVTGSDATPTFIVDIGSRSTAIAFIEGGQLKFSAQSDFAGASLTQALASSLNINPVRAEELKKEHGILGTGPNYELSTIMIPFLDGIISEVKRAEFNYHAQFPGAPKAERILLSGGGANLLGIEKYMERQFGIPTLKASPFSKFEYRPEMQPLVPELNPLLAVALGLALKEFTS